jgi:hypothetical protein
MEKQSPANVSTLLMLIQEAIQMENAIGDRVKVKESKACGARRGYAPATCCYRNLFSASLNRCQLLLLLQRAFGDKSHALIA